MKKRIHTLFTTIMLLCLPFSALAAERNFPAGSLIIPMDSYYQPDADGGVLESYGVVFHLLQNNLKVYWMINQEKVDIQGTDFVIEDNTLEVGEVAVELYDHGDGSGNLPLDHASAYGAYKAGDTYQRVTYSGAPFLIDGADAPAARTLLSDPQWSAVEMHEAKVPFKAPVYREMRGTPPRIALMNDSENETGGNATILESYLRLGGICTDVYDVLTPNQIRDGILMTGNGESDGIDNDEDGEVDEPGEEAPYDFLWAPHWTGYGGYNNDNDGNGLPDVEDIVIQVREFLAAGKGLLAECASIEVFEHSANGRFLSTKGFGHNGGTMDQNKIIYNDATTPNSQIADFEFDAEGGHLHNWRPFHLDDNYNLSPDPDEAAWVGEQVTAASPSAYYPTVTRFTVDDTDNDGVVEDTDWDYYVGGYAYGDPSEYGYVVYLGGHKYASCGSSLEPTVDPELYIHTLEFEFTKDITTEVFTLTLDYNGGSSTTVNFWQGNFTAISGDPLEIDMTTAAVDSKKILNITVRNKGTSAITVDAVTVSWLAGTGVADQKFKKIIDRKTDLTIYDKPELVSPAVVTTFKNPFSLEGMPDTSYTPACNTHNDDCSWKNIAGVRYILNTLFNIKFQLQSSEFVRAAPIASHDYLYQGTFEYPSFQGHFRRYTVTADSASSDWDTADRIGAANESNADGRKVYTSKKDINGDWQKINFDIYQINDLVAPLAVTPSDGDDTDEIAVVTRVRGKKKNSTGQWVERSNKLGGIMHSAPAIVSDNSRFSVSRDEVAYVGDLYGMLHAIETADGDEKWAFIPNNLLGKLKNDRSDPNAVQDFAAVDASPAVRDVFYDHDGDSDKEWRTVLVCPEGFGGRYIFALDITDPDPDDFLVLWEVTVDAIVNYTGSGGFSVGDTVTGATSGVTAEVVADDTGSKDLTLGEVSGRFQDGETVFVDSNSSGVFEVGELSATVNKVAEMGHAYRVSLNKVKSPVRDVDDQDSDGDTDEIIGYEAKWVVFVATGFARIAETHGGINVFAFDLISGERLWYFSTDYADSVNDIPGAITTFDTDGDSMVDRVYVGDMNGRLWELNAVDGTNPHGTDTNGKQIPLWNCGVGYPISVSPAITRNNANHVIVIFGTGGADWANEFDPDLGEQPHAIYVVDATQLNTSPDYDSGAGTLLWKLDLAKGEKVWSAPTVAAHRIYLATGFGEMESSDPGNDTSGTGNLYSIDMSGNISWKLTDVGKARGSIYVDRQHVYLTTIDGQIKQIGDEDFTQGQANNVIVTDWRDF